MIIVRDTISLNEIKKKTNFVTDNAIVFDKRNYFIYLEELYWAIVDKKLSYKKLTESDEDEEDEEYLFWDNVGNFDDYNGDEGLDVRRVKNEKYAKALKKLLLILSNEYPSLEYINKVDGEDVLIVSENIETAEKIKEALLKSSYPKSIKIFKENDD